MRNLMGQSVSLWMDESELTESTKVRKSFSDEIPRDFEICVIGGGIAGLTTAYFLAKGGHDVALIERGDIGEGESGRTTAQFSTVLEERYYELEGRLGGANVKTLAHAHREAITLVEGILAVEGFECNAKRVPGYLFGAPDGAAIKNGEGELDREYEAALRAGVRVERGPALLPSLSADPWLVFPDQLQLHPRKYLQGLADAFMAAGGTLRIHEEACRVRWLKPDHAEITLADGRSFGAGSVVTATNTPFVDLLAMHTKQAAYRTYVIAGRIPREAVPRALFWDTADPYHYVRLEDDPEREFERIIVGGEDHKTGQAANSAIRWAKLEAWTRNHFPMMKEITHRWSGQVMEPADGVAFAGRNPTDSPHSYVITGHSGNGMTYGTIGARLVADLIDGRENQFARLLSPSRKSFSNAPEYVRENANAFAQYADYFRGSEIDLIAELARDEGAVIHRKGRAIGIYRDFAGRLRACSAICPHLGAILRWNSAERSWDCPAHGSRFDSDGRVLNGPANEALEPRQEYGSLNDRRPRSQRGCPIDDRPIP